MNAMTEMNRIIKTGKTALGLELGSTRIKAVLLDPDHRIIASGSHEWENRFENRIWTYDLDDAWDGVRDCYALLADDVIKRYGVELTTIGAIGISGMMHGYLPFDAEGRLLVPFRTWRNTMTGEAAEILTRTFGFNIPQRWSIAHLYQAMLNGEQHVGEIAFMTTLAGYIHWQLTGEKVLGIGEASGMFPINPETLDYNEKMMDAFAGLTENNVLHGSGASVELPHLSRNLRDILPKVLIAGKRGGRLTAEGVKKLDPKGKLNPGIPFSPPEGDAGTGMAATNSVAVGSGNVSAGTSVFAMIVLDHDLENVHSDLDIVTTPDGHPVAMVHCNNCTSDMNAWEKIFEEFAVAIGAPVDRSQIFGVLFEKALEGEPDAGGLLAYNFLSGEHILKVNEGRPLLVRSSKSRFTLANFMRANLMTSLCAIKVGIDVLKKEKVAIDRVYGHGGFFKTPVVGQRILAAAINAPISVMENAGEGGAFGQAVLAAYLIWRKDGENLSDYLQKRVFAGSASSQIIPDPQDVEGFEKFAERYVRGIAIEQEAIRSLV